MRVTFELAPRAGTERLPEDLSAWLTSLPDTTRKWPKSPKQLLCVLLDAFVDGLTLEIPVRFRLGFLKVRRVLRVKIGKRRLLEALGCPIEE